MPRLDDITRFSAEIYKKRNALNDSADTATFTHQSRADLELIRDALKMIIAREEAELKKLSDSYVSDEGG